MFGNGIGDNYPYRPTDRGLMSQCIMAEAKDTNAGYLGNDYR